MQSILKTFEVYWNHIEASRKLNLVTRITRYMTSSKKRILMNAFFKSQFKYFPLMMCYNRYLNNEINWLHEWCLCIVYNEKMLNFEELLERDGCVSTQ